MECPKCGKELKHVNVYSTYVQRAKLQGNEIVGYGKLEGGDDIEEIECPHCYESLLDDIEV